MQFKEYSLKENCSEILWQAFLEGQKRNLEILREKLYIQVAFDELR